MQNTRRHKTAINLEEIIEEAKNRLRDYDRNHLTDYFRNLKIIIVEDSSRTIKIEDIFNVIIDLSAEKRENSISTICMYECIIKMNMPADDAYKKWFKIKDKNLL